MPETLFRSIEDFQQDQGLDVDGVMLPGGLTLGRINALLPTARPKRPRGDTLQSPKPTAKTPAGEDDDGPSFADLYKQRLDAGEPQGFGPAFAPFERPVSGDPTGLDETRAILVQARTQRQTPSPSRTQRAPAPRPAQTPPRPSYPPARSLPPLAPPPEGSGFEIPRFGQEPIGPRSDGGAGRVLRSFADAIARAESADASRRAQGVATEYQTVHRGKDGLPDAWGRYQLNAGGMRAAQVWGQTGEWNGPLAQEYGINSAEDYLNNPAAQEEALRRYILDAQNQIRRAGLDRYIGRTLDGVAGRFVITLPGLVAAIHRGGPGNLRHYFRERERLGWRTTTRDLVGNDRDDRRRELHREIESRLRVFAFEPMSTE